MSSAPTMPKLKDGPGAGFHKEDLPGAMGDTSKFTGRTGKAAAIMRRDALEVDRQMRIQRPQPATVINMQPFALKVNGVLHEDLVVPACPEGYEYTAYVIRNYKRAHKDQGDGKFAFVPVVPLQLAHEFEREFNTEDSEYGGVFYYPGDFLKADEDIRQYFHLKVKRMTRPEDPDSEPEVTIGELFERAHERMIANARRMYAEAERLAADPKTTIAINERHRRAFHILHKHGFVTDAPRWVAHTRRVEEIGETCQMCQVEAKPNSVVCANCHYPFDVVLAYKAGMLDRNSPHLGRMTPKQLERFKLTHVTTILEDEEIAAIDARDAAEARQAKAIKDSAAKAKDAKKS